MSLWKSVQVEHARPVAEGVLDICLAAVDGSPLPIAPPGAHVDLRLPDGTIRQYSVHDCFDGRYHLGIGLAEPSRGGSAYIHEQVKQGDWLEVGAPRNLFALDPDADGYLFIAGGIGITPILSMVRWCKAHNKRWRLLYSNRNRARTAYMEEIGEGLNVHLHLDEETGRHADLQRYVRELQSGEHLYCCGPGPMMDAVERVAEGEIGTDRLHFERFKAPISASDIQLDSEDASFMVTLAQSGTTLSVPAQTSLLDALEQAGVAIPYSCREGMCRTCECAVLEGEVDHRDYVLSEAERNTNQVILPCVSRARSAALVLDL